MKIILSLIIISTVCFSEDQLIGWKDGQFGYQISRPSLETCNLNVKVAKTSYPVLKYDSWIRSRAAIQNLCFEVNQKDATYFYKSDKVKPLDVTVKYQSADNVIKSFKAKYLKHINNKAIYYFGLWLMDPYNPAYNTAENTTVNFFIYVNNKLAKSGQIIYSLF